MRSARVVFGFLLWSATVAAQQYVISTYAGGAPPATPAPAVDVSIGSASGIATDATGNVYFASSDLNSVFKLDRSGVLTRVAGNSRPGYSGDGGPATSARLQLGTGFFFIPAGVAVDNAGALFIADTGNDRIRRISPSGIITTVAGGGPTEFGDGGPATSASLSYPTGVAVDGAGNLFIADLGKNRVRKVSPSGIIVTVAGNGAKGFSGDGGPAISAELNQPRGVAVDGEGNLFIADAFNFRIRKVSPNGIITTVAGNGTRGVSPDGGPADQLDFPTRVAVDTAGNLFIADAERIRKISRDGIMVTVAGGGFSADGAPSGDSGPATSAKVSPTDAALDSVGNLFIAGPGVIRKVSADGIIHTVAGNGTWSYFGSGPAGDGGPATGAQLKRPSSVAVDSAGNLFIADAGNRRVRKMSPSGTITTVAGNGTSGISGDGGPATSAQLSFPFGMALGGAGDLFIADSNRIRKVATSGTITTVAGGGAASPADGGPATSARLDGVLGVAVDGAGNLFIADSGSRRIRKVSPSGIITTVAGGGTLSGPSGDGGPASSAQLNGPYGVAVDGAGNLFIVEYGYIRKVSASGIISTVAGGGAWGTSAHLSWPGGVAVDGAGNLYIAVPYRGMFADDGDDAGDNTIRKVSPGGIITTIAGGGVCCYSGDGGQALSAQLADPVGVAVDSVGNVYVADYGNHAIRILRPTNQSVLIGAVVDAASQRADPVSPGKIVVLYGGGLGPSQLSAAPAGTAVSFNGIAAPILYTSATQIAAVVPYAVSGTTAQVTVAYRGDVSAAFAVPVAASAPSLFTLNQTGAGQAAAINAVDGTVNTAANPVRIGGFISLYATGEGQTGSTTPPRPVLPVRVTVGGIPATIQYAGGAPGQVAGLMQVNVQIPSGVQPGGYVPVVLQVGDRASSSAVWIAVGN